MNASSFISWVWNLQVAAGLVEVPSQVMLDGVSRNIGNLPVKVKVDYMKVSHTIGAMVLRVLLSHRTL